MREAVITKAEDDLEIVRGIGHVFRDIRIPDEVGTRADPRSRCHEGGVQRAAISRVCSVDLGRFTIDRLVRIANQLDRRVGVAVTPEPQPKAARA